jgi:two-component system nitrate/nitrite response regulator NarL
MKVVICDDHRLFAEALAYVLTARAWTIVGKAANPAHAVAVVARTQVDLCLMDLTFVDDTTGIAGIAAVHEASPNTKVVVLTASSDPALIISAVQSGADAIAFKNDEIDRFIDIAERTVDGRGATETTLGRGSSSGMATRGEHATEASGEPLVRFLTDRELEVLDHLVCGESAKTLARALGISYSTGRTHIQNILAKLGAHSRVEAVAFAIDNDLGRPRLADDDERSM